MASLDCCVDTLKSVGTVFDHRFRRPIGFGESCSRFVRPLHWCARAVPLRQNQVISHAKLVAITNHWRSRQREHQAVSELEAALIAAQHRRKPASNSAIV